MTNNNFPLKVTSTKAEITTPIPNSKNVDIEVDVIFENPTKKDIIFDQIKEIHKTGSIEDAKKLINEIKHKILKEENYPSEEKKKSRLVQLTIEKIKENIFFND